MNDTPKFWGFIDFEPTGFSILEYARMYNRLDMLRYNEDFIDKLILGYKFDVLIKDILWNCLESAARQYFYFHHQVDLQPNPHAVQRVLRRAKRHIDGLQELFPLLQMWVSVDGKIQGDIGKIDRFKAIGINDALSFFRGFEELEMIYRQKSGLRRGFLNKEYLVAMAEDMNRIRPILTDISERFAEFTEIQTPKKDRNPELYALKVWATSIMRFWVEIANKSVKLGRMSASPDKGIKHKTLVNSEIGRFCYDCLLVMRVEPNIRTPLKTARDLLIDFYTNNRNDTSERSLARLRGLDADKTNSKNH